MVMVAENSPSLLAVTVSSRSVSNVIAIGAPETNPVPVMVTRVSTGPDDGLSEMVGLPPEPEVLKSHSQLSSTPFESKQSKKFPSSSWMLDDIDAM